MIYCVSAFAGHFGLNFKQAYSYLKRFKGIAFLDECYEAEHQLSINDMQTINNDVKTLQSQKKLLPLQP